MDRLLLFIDKNTDSIGKGFDLKISDANDPLCQSALAETEAISTREVVQIEHYLRGEGLLEDGLNAHGLLRFIIRPLGYQRIRELELTQKSSTFGFIAMWFDNSMDDAFNRGIAPGIRDAGYEPLRIDRTEFEGKIDDQIIAEIRRSRFLVADFTQGEPGARGGVYYEAGFAHGLNIPVFFTCRADALGKVHFDTRQYNHITWETPEELRERLANRISAVIGDGPLKPHS